jgi:uncharacterized protein YggE
MKFYRLLLVPAALLAALAVGCSEDTTYVQGGDRVNAVSAAGTGKVTGTPDIVTVQLGVDVEMRTVEAARTAAATSMQAAIDSLKANGVEQKDIQTVQFSVQPQYDFNQGRQSLRGYRVSNVVSAKIRKLDTVSKVIDDVTRAAGDSAIVRSLSFSIEDPSKLQAQARELAVKQARERAEQLARPAGVDIGRVISISEGVASTPIQPQAAFAIPAPRTGEPATPIQTGELEVVVNVTAVFAIE